MIGGVPKSGGEKALLRKLVIVEEKRRKGKHVRETCKVGSCPREIVKKMRKLRIESGPG